MVGVVAHQRRQIERDRKPGLALRKQIAEALVGIFGGAETGELPHRPEPAAMHGGMNAAGVGRFARKPKLLRCIPARQIGFWCRDGESDDRKLW